MTDMLYLVLAFVMGLSLGAVFFGGLWWTIRKGMTSDLPALWFSGSLLLRMGITLTGFYLIARGHWERLLICLVGFVLARLVVTRLVHQQERAAHLEQEARHAHES